MPKVWWEVWSEEHERFYYHEAEGDETTWELPEGEGIVVLRWEEEEEGAVAADKAKTKVPDDEAAAASQTQVQEEEEAGKSDTLVPSVVREKAKSTLQLAIDQCVQVDEDANAALKGGDPEKAMKLYRWAVNLCLQLFEKEALSKESEQGKQVFDIIQHYLNTSKTIERQTKQKVLQSKSGEQKVPVVQELLDSERRYHQTLQDMKGLYLDPIADAFDSLETVLDREQHSTIFGSFPLILQHSSSLSSALARLPPRSDKVGGVLRESMEHLGGYELYVEKMEEALALSKKLKEENDFFRHFCDRGGAQTVLKGGKQPAAHKPLDFYLIEPFQRVFRYKMLLERLLENTSPQEEEERTGLGTALGRVSALCAAMNDGKRKREDQSNLARIRRSLKGEAGVDPYAKCIRQGSLRWVRHRRKDWVGAFSAEVAGSMRDLLGSARPAAADAEAHSRWYYLFDDGLLVSEVAESYAEEQGFFDTNAAPARTTLFWNVATGVREAGPEEEGEEGGGEEELQRRFVVESRDYVRLHYRLHEEVLQAGTEAEKLEWMNVIRMMAVKRQFRDDFATHKITPEEAFRQLDVNEDGELDEEEMWEALQRVGVKISKQDAVKVFREMDEDGNGSISREEFCTALRMYGDLRRNRFGSGALQRDQSKKCCIS